MSLDLTKYQGDGTIESDPSQPFLKIIQKGSAEFDETNPKYKFKAIPGCKPGDILFQGTGQILPKPVRVIPLGNINLYAEWRKRDEAGGFIRHHPLTITAHKDYRKHQNKEYLGQNELYYTIYWFVLAEIDGEWIRAIVPFTATELKIARRWRTMIKNHVDEQFKDNPPVYAAIWNMGVFIDSNSKGSWYNWDISKETALVELEEAEAVKLLETCFETNRQVQQEQGLMLEEANQELVEPTEESSDELPY